jgi:hypothetical protein
MANPRAARSVTRTVVRIIHRLERANGVKIHVSRRRRAAFAAAVRLQSS